MYSFFIVVFLFITSCQAMLSDGIHPHQAYVDYAKTQEAFKASCFVYDDLRGVLQTGVLIAPDIVMTAAHGFEGHIHLDSIIVGFGDEVTDESLLNYKVESLRRHPRFRQEPYPLQAKYDIVFLKLTAPVKGIEPVPLFEEKELDEIPPLYVASFGSADIPPGIPVQRRAFVLPETDIFPISSDDPDVLQDTRTVMMGSVFFKPHEILKSPDKVHATERGQRTFQANLRWHQMGKPPYALALPGSSGSPVFIQLDEAPGVKKTYVFGLVQSFSHLSAASFKHPTGDRETQHLLKGKRDKIWGRYQSVFCIPYEVHHIIKPHQKERRIFKIEPIVKKIVEKLEKPQNKRKKN